MNPRKPLTDEEKYAAEYAREKVVFNDGYELGKEHAMLRVVERLVEQLLASRNKKK
jgi:hypothetical protein